MEFKLNKAIALVFFLINLSIIFAYPYKQNNPRYNDTTTDIQSDPESDIDSDIANNKFYFVGISRDRNDTSYELETKRIKLAINKLVNDRMNDIYNIIYENRDSYDNDDLLKELDYQFPIPSNKKFKFVNTGNNEILKGLNGSKYIPNNSTIVEHLSPESNYYVIRAYLSDVTVEKVKQLPNIIFVNEYGREYYGYYNNDPIPTSTYFGVDPEPTTTDIGSDPEITTFVNPVPTPFVGDSDIDSDPEPIRPYPYDDIPYASRVDDDPTPFYPYPYDDIPSASLVDDDPTPFYPYPYDDIPSASLVDDDPTPFYPYPYDDIPSASL
ncbi:hypothetical protein PIROE2DRAFT_7120, partial [Piromyces sp. E2]